MESWWLPTWQPLLVLLPTMLLLYHTVSSWPRGERCLPLPPGPRGLPFVGNILHTSDMTHRGLAQLASRYGGLLHLRLGRLRTVVVSTPEMARLVLHVNDRAFADRPTTAAIDYLTYDRADMVFAPYGPLWRQLRKLCINKLFNRRRAASWDAVHDGVDSLLREVAKNSGAVVNVGELVFGMSMKITLRAALGMRNEGKDAAELVAVLKEFSEMFGASNLADYVPWVGWLDVQGFNRRMVAARAALDRLIDRAIDEHLEHPKPVDAADADMVDGMLSFLDVDDMPECPGVGAATTKYIDGADACAGMLRLSRDNIKATIMDVLFGGTETSATTIEWAMSELMSNPEEMKRVQDELAEVVGLHRQVKESDLIGDKLPYFRCVVKETLRMHPPAPLLHHEAGEDCDVAGYRVPKKTRVLINVWAIGRNASVWGDDPDAFRPARFGSGTDNAETDYRGGHFHLLPFGSGRRSCPGMQLGMLEVELALARLLHGFDWSLPGGTAGSAGELDMEDTYGLTAPRAVRLSAVPVPRLSHL
uniref:Cytochrome P450 n=1 Tax=Oryza punctata TaxID=4537 RepID=A0A0E0KTB7_ORYPU